MAAPQPAPQKVAAPSRFSLPAIAWSLAALGVVIFLIKLKWQGLKIDVNPTFSLLSANDRGF